MPDVSEQYLQQQSDILRDIRDELRSSRTSAGMVGGASNGRTFTQAQSAIDRTLSGEWNTLGWSNAYSSTYRSSFTGDIAALTGFQRAPETLTQQEFQALAGQNVLGRLGSGALGMLAPGFNARSNALADEIYSHSGRFIRFGNASAGVTGAGFNHDVARSLGRQISLEALGDMRLSQKDYGTITSLGMQSGQFDQVSGTDDFKRKVRELASATGDLTRALHMTVQEVGTAMGNMRMLGVTNVGQQRQMMMQAGTAAMVAGMSAPEMMAFAGGVAGNGLQLGLGAQSAFGLGANNMAMVRGMSSAGLLQNGILAMGGGASAVAGNISQAQMNFAASNAGMLTFMGGGAAGGDQLGAMLRGLGKVGGSYEDLVSMGYDKVKNLSGMTGDDISSMFSNRIRSQLSMVGVNDHTSRMAQGMAFRMARSMGMEDAAAHIFVQSQFSEEGLRNADATRIQGRRAESFREQALSYDKYLMQNSLAGSVQRVMRGAGSVLGDTFNRGMRNFEVGQGSNFFSAGGFSNDVTGMLSGAMTGDVDLASIAGALSADHIGDKVSSISVSGASEKPWGRFLGMDLYKPLGWAFDSRQDVTDSAVISDIQATNRAVPNINVQAGRRQILSGIAKGQAWEKLASKKNRTKQTAEEFIEMSSLAAAAAKEMGVSVQDVYNMAGAAGADIKLSDSMAFGASNIMVSKSGMDAVSEILGDVSKTSNLATAGNSAAMSSYLDAFVAGNGTVSAEIDMAAASAIRDSDNFDRMRATLSSLIKTEAGRGKIKEASETFKTVNVRGGQVQLDKIFEAARGYAGELAGSSRFSEATSAAITKELSGGNFLGALNDENGEFHKAARGGSMGELFKQAASVASNDELAKMSAMQIANMYHLSGTDIMKVKEKNPGQLRNAIQASILGQEAVSREQAVTQPVRQAELLNKAAMILDRLSTQANAKQ